MSNHTAINLFEILFLTQDDFRFEQIVECYGKLFQVNRVEIIERFEELNEMIEKVQNTTRKASISIKNIIFTITINSFKAIYSYYTYSKKFAHRLMSTLFDLQYTSDNSLYLVAERIEANRVNMGAR